MTSELNHVEMSRNSRLSRNDIENDITSHLGEKYAEYRKAWDNSSNLENGTPAFPIHLDIELNDMCNQSCVMCPRNEAKHENNGYELNTKKSLTEESVMQIILDGASKGLKSINFGAFAEPLIHKGLWNLIKNSHENGVVDSRVITNGLLLHKYINEVFSSGLINLFVSLDAHSSETYSKIRGKGYDRVRQNLLEVVQAKKDRGSFFPIIRVSWVDMAVNSHEKEAFIDYWSGIVDHVDIQTWSDFTRPPNQKELNLPKKFECRSPWQRIALLANGEILPCCDFNGRNIPIGNIGESTLEDAWNSSEMQNVRTNLLNDQSSNCNACQRCFSG